MLVLFDNGTPRTLARYLINRHAVTEARARGWDKLENGKLLTWLRPQDLRFWLPPTKISAISKILRSAIVVLGQGRWSLIKRHVSQVAAAVGAATPGSYVEVEIPDD